MIRLHGVAKLKLLFTSSFSVNLVILINWIASWNCSSKYHLPCRPTKYIAILSKNQPHGQFGSFFELGKPGLLIQPRKDVLQSFDFNCSKRQLDLSNLDFKLQLSKLSMSSFKSRFLLSSCSSSRFFTNATISRPRLSNRLFNSLSRLHLSFDYGYPPYYT